MTKLFIESKNVKVDVYSECKYTASEKALENKTTIELKYCTGFEVVTGSRAAEIEAHTDGSCVDDYHEYLVLFFEDGNTSTFRNSYVDLFALQNSNR